MARTFSTAEGLVPVDFTHCALDHMTAARALFDTDPSHYDSAGYLAHIGVELLLKGWLLQVAGQFEGIHNLTMLYERLAVNHGAPTLNSAQLEVLVLLDQYEQLRYPNPIQPTEVGNRDWPRIEALVGFLCRSMPQQIAEALGQVVPGRKAGRVLMKKKREPVDDAYPGGQADKHRRGTPTCFVGILRAAVCRLPFTLGITTSWRMNRGAKTKEK